MTLARFKFVADHAVLVEFGTEVSDDLNRLVVALDSQINAADIAGVIETVPALVNMLVVFDPIETDHVTIEAAIRCLLPVKNTDEHSATTHRVPVCYDAELTPDLAAVAAAVNLSVDAVIKAHLSQSLRVSMYGFAPGFAYLSGVDKTIQVPRKPAATRDIPKGQVMIAGPQCLITTVVMPTGWSIIGRTAFEVMQSDPDNPFIFKIGDTVKFERTSRSALPAEMQKT